ncbi:MAG: hydrogenase expression/formation protein [Magnetospirillum sp. WYHS-4]
MKERDAIPGGNPAPTFASQADTSSANAPSVLHQIRHALAVLLDGGGETTIDLKSLPFGPADLTALQAALGEGEVEASVRAFGESRLRETGVPGVWTVEHLGPAGEVRARFVEVTFMPALLRADPADVQDGLRRLADRLADGEDAPVPTLDERKPS